MLMRCKLSLPFIAAGGAWVLLAAAAAGAADDAPTRRAPWTASRLHGSPDAPEPYQIVSAFPNLRFEKPTCIEVIPGLKRLLVTEMAGKILSFAKDAAASEVDLVVDLRAALPRDLAERGVSLFDAEFHPRFGENRQLFVCYVHPGDGGHTRVSRLTLDDASPPQAVPDSEQVIITWPSGGHNGGCLEFDAHGYLYISTGDGSGPNPPDGLTTGQTVNDLLGAVLRIDIDRTAGDQAYAIPADNPFVDMPEARPEIWAYGFRNPWKFGVDPQTGDAFVADNGWESWEMVHRLERGATAVGR